MHRLVRRQLKKSTDASGAVDYDRFVALVTSAYEDFDRDRRRTDRSIALMVEELDQLNRSLERLVAERTTALRAREAELREQNRRFDAAIDHMSQALLLFDKDARLVICNRRYLEMYGLADETARPGTHLLDLLKARAATGTFDGNAEDAVAEVFAAVARKRSNRWFTELPDGRAIEVVVHPMADGGWVTTHEDVSDRRDAEKRIAHMTRHDGLTDLPNRVLLLERLGEAVARLRGGRRVAVLYLDLDHFKSVNDTLGHAAGDDLLIAVAARIRDCIDDHDLVARVGGDEFAVVQADIAGGAETAALATCISDAFKTPFEINGNPLVVEASIGISLAPDDAGDPADLLKHADMALRRAKAESRGSFRFFEPEMDARMKVRRKLEAALRQALALGQFELHYQPVVNLASGRITCCEALIRWSHAELGEVSPEVFVPIAEEIGLIVPMGEWVLRQACADAARWSGDIGVAINLSPIQLHNPGLVPIVVNALSAAGVPPERLEIEITESVLMHNTATTLAALHRLRSLGIRISMDDFGTGYSSLSNLRSFPFDKIKIDRSFISGLPDGEDAVAIVRAVASLARSLNIATTAEGVETAAQMERVRELGCTEMQGYFFSRPRPSRHIEELIAPQAMPRAMTA